MVHSVALEGFSSKDFPLFYGSNYTFWIRKIDSYWMALGFEIQRSVLDGYEILNIPPRDQACKKVRENNSRARNVIVQPTPSL